MDWVLAKGFYRHDVVVGYLVIQFNVLKNFVFVLLNDMSMKCSQPIGIEERWRQPMGSGGWSGRRSPTFAPDLNGRNSVEGQLGASLRLFWLPLTFLENEVQPNTFRQERVEHCTQEAMETPWSRAKFILSIFRANSGNKCRRSNWIKQSLPLFSNAPDIRYISFSSSRIANSFIKH